MQAVRRGSYVLMADAENDGEADQAMDVMARHGPVDIDEVSSRWRRARTCWVIRSRTRLQHLPFTRPSRGTKRTALASDCFSAASKRRSSIEKPGGLGEVGVPPEDGGIRFV